MSGAELHDNGHVRSSCPGCDGAVSTFAPVSLAEGDAETGGYDENTNCDVVFRLMRCTICGDGALARIEFDRADELYGHESHVGELRAFYPPPIVRMALPDLVPPGVIAEIREAELCSSAGAFRAGVAMLRSALEKLLAANGYTKKRDGDLKSRIDAAARDTTITGSDARRAHDNVRLLGNEVVHDDWRPISEVEWDEAHRYVKRVVDCLYDHRPTALALLIDKGRMKAEGEPVDA